MRVDGKTLRAMAIELTEEGYDVSLEKVRRWCHRYGIPTHRVPAAVVASQEVGE
jgi:hypothetical protein